jgi:hypothetical protein
MTIKSMLQLLAQADADLPDNSTRDISAADVRVLIKDFIDSITPAYGTLQLSTQTKTLNATPSKIAPFSSSFGATPGYFTTNISDATVTRQVSTALIAGASDLIIISGAVSGANNANVLVRLFKNGVATGYLTSVTCSGAGDDQGFSLVGITYTDAGDGDAVYDLRASSSSAGSFVFSDINVVVQAIPVRSYV